MQRINKTLVQKSNRKYKDSVFTTYYGEAENAADLFRALTQAEDIGAADIEFTTLTDVLYMARKNDMAFTVKKEMLIIGEHQSTINFNMPLRSAIYYGRTMEKIFDSDVIYREKKVEIPTPEFYVFYNGVKEQPAEQILKLSDSYLITKDDVMMDLKIRMININFSVRHPLLERCRSLYEYSYFIECVREKLNKKMGRDQAIRNAMDECVQAGIMVDFIKKHGSEVRNMLFTEFNLEDAKRVWREEAREDGLEEGRREGRREGHREGRKEGRKEGRNESLQVFVKFCMKRQIPQEECLKELQQGYKLEYEQAKAYLEGYQVKS